MHYCAQHTEVRFILLFLSDIVSTATLSTAHVSQMVKKSDWNLHWKSIWIVWRAQCMWIFRFNLFIEASSCTHDQRHRIHQHRRRQHSPLTLTENGLINIFVRRDFYRCCHIANQAHILTNPETASAHKQPNKSICWAWTHYSFINGLCVKSIYKLFLIVSSQCLAIESVGRGFFGSIIPVKMVFKSNRIKKNWAREKEMNYASETKKTKTKTPTVGFGPVDSWIQDGRVYEGFPMQCIKFH